MQRSNSDRPTPEQQQAFAQLKQCRDQILGLAWCNYLKYGKGAIRFRAINGSGEIYYKPLALIADYEVIQLIQQTDPATAVVVLYDYGDWYDILTLSGPQKPPECYALLFDVKKGQ